MFPTKKMVEIVIPGQRLGFANDFNPSKGTFAKNGFIYASVMGSKRILEREEGQYKRSIQVIHDKKPSPVPQIGDVIIGTVFRVNPRFATVRIQVIDTVPCSHSFQGVIRLNDVRATEMHKVQIYKSFRPGDVVRLVNWMYWRNGLLTCVLLTEPKF